jgi:spore coat protein H
MTRIKVAILTLFLIGITSCYKELELPADTGEVFELSVTPEMQDVIYNSRDSSYTVNEPGIAFLLDGEPLELDEIRVRGKNALNYQRKSYMVKLHTPVALSGRDGSGITYLSRFKLISMAMDYTYIENRVALGILENQELMPLFYRYVELKINGSTQGVYMLVEDPEKYYKEIGSEFILRRGYYNSIEDSEYHPSSASIPRETYETRFFEIYSSLISLQGEELYNALTQRLDIDQYFRKMGIDYLLQNGDYTDEIFLYGMLHQDQIRYSIIPWDYDDIFSSNPHEVGLTWGTGRLFGERHYESRQDILDEIGDKLIFSIEDDLDYTIAMDPYLYARYQSTLAGMAGKMRSEDFDALFEQVKMELTPFYNNNEVVMQSKFDKDETSYRLWEENMTEKKALLKQRLGEMKEQLKQIQP